MKKEFWIYRVLDHYYLYNKNTYSKKDILSEQLNTFDVFISHNNILSDDLIGMRDREVRSLTIIVEELIYDGI